MSQQSDSQTSHSVSGDGKITIIVKDQYGTEVRVRLNRNMKLKVLMDMYCKKKQLDYDRVRFIHEGVRVFRKHTPEKLNMEDGAEIFCMGHQHGGATFTN